MIPLRFYRDNEYVYINNPDGTTRKVLIADFESAFDVDTSAVMVVNKNASGTLDTSWQDIYDAIDAGKCVYLRYLEEGGYYILETIDSVGTDIMPTHTSYVVRTHFVDNGYLIYYTYSADTPTGTLRVLGE